MSETNSHADRPADHLDEARSGGIIRPYKGIMPRIHEDAFIAEGAVIIGDVEIGARSSIWYGCALRGDMNEIRVGEDTNIQDGTIVHVDSKTYGTYIGNRVTIGHMALIHAATLEDESMVGMRGTVMDGAVLGSRALVAAGSLVTPGKQIGAGEVWAGSPARKLRDLNDKDAAMLDYIWPGYQKLGHDFIDQGLDQRDQEGRR